MYIRLNVSALATRHVLTPEFQSWYPADMLYTSEALDKVTSCKSFYCLIVRLNSDVSCILHIFGLHGKHTSTRILSCFDAVKGVKNATISIIE